MKVAIAQINPTIGALKSNREKIIFCIERAKKEKADLVVFPELSLCGYPPEDILLSPHFLENVEKELTLIVKSTVGITALVGTIRRAASKREKGLHNSCAVLVDGKIVGYQDKTLLPEYDVFYERRYFESGEGIGVWDIKGKKIALSICEDIWRHACVVSYPNDPLEKVAKSDLHINLSASPFSVGRAETRLQVAEKASHFTKTPLILCNQVGAQDGLIFDGTSIALDGEGKLIATLARFEEDFRVIDTKTKGQSSFKCESRGQELFMALKLGLRDYFLKQGFKKALLGLSGGIDSAVVACIAVEALGKENVSALFMPSRYTSNESRLYAEQLARSLGLDLREISIEEPFKAYLATLDSTFEGKMADLTQENIQSRIRGMILMAHSNQEGSLVLSCANKSEAALGYTTLYGDLCGALCPLGDVKKGDVYEIAQFINREKQVIPEKVLTREPTAELKADQKDSDTLPPYPLLDQVIAGAIEEGLDTETIAKQHRLEREVVQKIMADIHRNEYKRRQMPLNLRVSQKAFMIGRRVPIVHQWERNDRAY